MSNEPTPDTPDADDSASASADPAADESSAVSPSDEADPTVDMMSDFSPVDGDESADAAAGVDDTPAEPATEPAGSSTDSPEPTTTGPAGSAAESTEPITAGPTDSYVPPQTPPSVMAPPVRRLVRDPYSRLGGVCSGIAHHTGVDVSLVRLAFVLATFFSGIGLILYLLAWLIVPRAEYWPPAPYEAGAAGGSVLQGRRLAYGLLAIGIVLVVFSGAGGFARMLVSVGLVGAGIYLLVQPQATTDPAVDSSGTGEAGGSAPPVPPTPGSTPTAPPTGAQSVGTAAGSIPADWQPAPGDVGPDTSGDEVANPLAGQVRTEADTAISAASAVPPAPVKTVYMPSPVPPRRRRIWPFLLIIGLLLIPVFLVGGAIAFLAGTNQDFSGTDVTITPATASEIPGRIDEGAGTITLDLTGLDVDDFTASATSAQEVEIDLNAGEVTVDLPPDLPVAIDASVSAGEISVFDRFEEGIRPRITTDDADAVLALDIRVGVGTITVDN